MDAQAKTAWEKLQEQWFVINQADKARSRALRDWVESGTDKEHPLYKAFHDAKEHHDMMLGQFFYEFHEFDHDHSYDVFGVMPYSL